MELDKALFLVLDTIDMSQALFVGIFLILLNRREKSSLLFLGMFLLSIGLIALSDVLEVLDSSSENLYYKLPIYFIWLTPSLLYAYVNAISILKKDKFTKVALSLGILELIIALVIYLLPANQRVLVEDSILYIIYQLMGFIFAFILISMIFLKIRKNSIALKNQYSSLENRDLIWVKQMVIFIMIYMPLSIIIELIITETHAEIIFTIIGVLITYWISYHGLLQQVSQNLITDQQVGIKNNTTKIKLLQEEKEERINTSEINLTHYKTILSKIESSIVEEELFLNSELTIVNIAERVSEHPRLISKVINTLNKENFNNYINSFRVEHAKQKLLNGESQHINIEGIGNDSGFKSNSSFYAAFKKQLKMTPLKFVKSIELQ